MSLFFLISVISITKLSIVILPTILHFSFSIKKTLLELGLAKDSLNNVFKKSEQTEKNSNQILEFTKEIKNKDEEFKIKIVEALWKIIYADKVSDIYETSLMRRLTGLIYLDSKIAGDIKEKIKNSFNK